MPGLNQVNIIGRLGKDCEVKFTNGGMAVANFTIATSESWIDKQTKEKKEKTEWHRIVAWGKLAEICGEYLQKGKMVYVCGSLQTRSWEQDGITKYTTEIKIKEMQMLDSRDSGQQQPQQQQYGPGSANYQKSNDHGQTYQNQKQPPPGGFDDDIPF